MSGVHVHLATNHIPVIGALIAVLLLGAAVLWKSEDLRRFSLYYLIGLGLVTVLVFLTGEPAEEAVEHTAGVSEALIEKHEDASKFGLIGIELMAALSFAGVAIKKLQLAQKKRYFQALLLLALITSGLMAWIANLGGQIRHTEIQKPGMAATATFDRSDARGED